MFVNKEKYVSLPSVRGDIRTDILKEAFAIISR